MDKSSTIAETDGVYAKDKKFINPQELNKIQQLTNSISEYIKSDVLYTDVADNFPIYRYSIIRVNRMELSKEIRQNNCFYRSIK